MFADVIVAVLLSVANVADYNVLPLQHLPDYNQFAGSIPSELGLLTGLTSLDLRKMNVVLLSSLHVVVLKNSNDSVS
jgi:hypothetical protein